MVRCNKPDHDKELGPRQSARTSKSAVRSRPVRPARYPTSKPPSPPPWQQSVWVRTLNSRSTMPPSPTTGLLASTFDDPLWRGSSPANIPEGLGIPAEVHGRVSMSFKQCGLVSTFRTARPIVLGTRNITETESSIQSEDLVKRYPDRARHPERNHGSRGEQAIRSRPNSPLADGSRSPGQVPL